MKNLIIISSILLYSICLGQNIKDNKLDSTIIVIKQNYAPNGILPVFVLSDFEFEIDSNFKEDNLKIHRNKIIPKDQYIFHNIVTLQDINQFRKSIDTLPNHKGNKELELSYGTMIVRLIRKDAVAEYVFDVSKNEDNFISVLKLFFESKRDLIDKNFKDGIDEFFYRWDGTTYFKKDDVPILDTKFKDTLSIKNEYLNYLADSYWNNTTDSAIYIMRLETGRIKNQLKCEQIALYFVQGGYGGRIANLILSSNGESIKFYIEERIQINKSKRKPKYTYQYHLYTSFNLSDFPFQNYIDFGKRQIKKISLEDYKNGNYLSKKCTVNERNQCVPDKRDY